MTSSHAGSPREWHLNGYTVSDDPVRLDLDVIHRFLQQSYWARNIPREVVARSMEHSLCFGVYLAETQVGFARVITDQATFGYLADVFILEEHRARGLARWLVRCILETSELKDLRRWLLATRDAHEIYRAVGFSSLAEPERFMEIRVANPYV